jgi:hypothetical protein
MTKRTKNSRVSFRPINWYCFDLVIINFVCSRKDIALARGRRDKPRNTDRFCPNRPKNRYGLGGDRRFPADAE